MALIALASPAWGQAWQVMTVDSTWSVIANTPAGALDSLSAQGYVSAQIDSTVADTLHVRLGPVATVRTLTVLGVDGGTITSNWRTEQGTRFRSQEFARDVRVSALALAARGFVDATLTPRVVMVSSREVDVTLQVDVGPRVPVVGVELAGGRGTARAFASRRAGLTAPTDADRVDLPGVRNALEGTGLFTSVGEPVLARADDGELIVQVPVVEAPPGLFDVVLGYLPPTGDGNGGVVGRGLVDLRNPFGGGRAASIEIERTPGLASSFAISASDPFLVGSPLGAGLAFTGTSRDSTLSRRRLAAEARYAFDRGIDLIATLAAETVRPGTFGAQEIDGRPRVRRTDDVLAGVGFSIQRLDRVLNPRRGVAALVMAEQGRRSGTVEGGGAGSQRRLTLSLRGYLPVRRRQTLVVGGDATITQQQVGADGLYDEGDLLRFGGAASFRGFDEAEFIARSYARAIAEYRFLFDDASYAFGFGDIGGFDQPAIPGREAERRALAGYGAGLRVRTALGLATVTYALNPDLGIGEGKIHVGLTVGL